MIHAHIDNILTKNIVGFECGTRADFDTRHGNDPLWVFIDHDIFNYRVDKSAFLRTPTIFYIDEHGTIQLRNTYP